MSEAKVVENESVLRVLLSCATCGGERRLCQKSKHKSSHHPSVPRYYVAT